jgi:hypothetical protein
MPPQPAGGAADGVAAPLGHALSFRVRAALTWRRRHACGALAALTHRATLSRQVMRLCRPSVAAEQPLRCAPEDLGHPVRRGVAPRSAAAGASADAR